MTVRPRIAMRTSVEARTHGERCVIDSEIGEMTIFWFGLPRA